MAISAEDRDFLVSLYVGYFNRAPDPAGLQFWIDQVEAGRDTNTIAADFAASPEAKSLYPFLTTPDVSSPTSFITAVYANLFNRAPDAAGQAFWEQQLSSGAVSPADAIDAIIKGATTAPDSTVLTNKNTVGLDFATDAGNTPGFTFELNGASGNAAKSAISGVTEDASTVVAAQAATDAYLNGVAGAGETLTLTTGLDDLTGSTSNDTFKGLIDKTTVANTTLSPLDEIDGGVGTDTLEVAVLGNLATTDLPTTITNVENITARATGSITVDTSGISGVTALSTTQSTDADLTAAATTDVSVSGATGAIDVDGGKDITVATGDASNDNINIGVNAESAGSVTLTDTDQGTGTTIIDGGTNITATTTTGTGDLQIGDGTDAPTGAVVASVTGEKATDGNNAAMGAVTVIGGSTVDVTTAANADLAVAAGFKTGTTITQSDVTVTGVTGTTSVKVAQTASTAEVLAVDAVAGVQETQTVTFVALAAGEETTVNGLTFTANKSLTANEVAQAFANLTNDDTQSATGPTANGVFTNASSTLDFTSGAASGATVTFTEVTAGANGGTGITVSDTAAAGNVSVAAGITGVAAKEAKTGVLGVINGAVVVADSAANSITTVSIDGYGDGSSIGDGAAALSLGSLASLSLSNSGGTNAGDKDATMLVDAAGVATLGLALNNVNGDVILDGAGDSALKTLNVTTSGASSTFQLTAAAATALTVDAAAALNVTGSTLNALETATITGAGDVTLGDVSTTLKTLSAGSATGAVSATVAGDTATVTTGSGADKITLDTTTVNKTVSTGAGNDTVTLASGTTALSALINAGTGDADILVMDAADIATASATTTFEANIDGFERVNIGNAAGQETVNLANLDDISYVITGSAAGTAQTQTFTVQQGTQEIGDVFTVTINGTAFTYTTTGTEADDKAVADAIVALINADANLQVSASAGTAADPSVVTLTSDIAGQAFTTAVSLTDGNTADAGLTTLAGNANAAGLTLNNMASNGTVQLTTANANNVIDVNLTDASGGADVLNVVAVNDIDTNFGIVDVAGVETINITATDTFVDANKDGKDDTDGDHTLTLAADKATSITVTGNALDLTVTGATALATVNASGTDDGFTYTADDGTTTVTGGSGADVLTASGASDVLIGGAGADTLTGANLTTLTGGDGADTFVLNVPTNVNSYSTISDLTTGDIIDLGAAATTAFQSAGITLANTAVFQDYANAAVNSLGTDADDAAWFQYAGDTYIVKSGNGTAADDFVNGEDAIIKITGVVDLSTASFNATNSTLEIA